MTENHKIIMFYDLCRLCLTTKGSVDIFDQAGLQSDITICTGIQITLSDNLPRKICTSCWDIVKKAMELRLVATKNNYHLKSLFEDANEEITICEDLMENLVQLEANNSTPMTLNINEVNSVINNSDKQESSKISVRKDIFEQVEYTIEVHKPKKAKKRRKDKHKSHDRDKRDETKQDTTDKVQPLVISVRKDLFNEPQTPEIGKKHKKAKKHKKSKSNDQVKRDETNLNTTECDQTPQISVRKDIFKEQQHTKEVVTNKAKKRLKENSKSNDDDGSENKLNNITDIECDLDESNKAKKRREEHIKSKDSDDNSKDQTKTDNNTECDTTETETKDMKKEFKIIKCDKDGFFHCEECPKKFDTHKKLYLHCRNHNKNISCPHESCDKKFATKGDLEKHVRIHTGEKPYKCEICDRTFSQRVTLRGHINAFH